MKLEQVNRTLRIFLLAEKDLSEGVYGFLGFLILVEKG